MVQQSVINDDDAYDDAGWLWWFPGLLKRWKSQRGQRGEGGHGREGSGTRERRHDDADVPTLRLRHRPCLEKSAASSALLEMQLEGPHQEPMPVSKPSVREVWEVWASCRCLQNGSRSEAVWEMWQGQPQDGRLQAQGEDMQHLQTSGACGGRSAGLDKPTA